MKRNHIVTIQLVLEGTEDLPGFDPKLHYNYEFIRGNDDDVAEMVQKAFQMALPGYVIAEVGAMVESSELKLTDVEYMQKEIYYTKQEEEDKKHYQELSHIAKLNGIKKAVWSLGHNKFDQVAVTGRVQFVITDLNGKILFLSKEYTNPTLLDAWKELDLSIEVTGDEHHVFLEGLNLLRNNDGVKLVDLITGS